MDVANKIVNGYSTTDCGKNQVLVAEKEFVPLRDMPGNKDSVKVNGEIYETVGVPIKSKQIEQRRELGIFESWWI